MWTYFIWQHICQTTRQSTPPHRLWVWIYSNTLTHLTIHSYLGERTSTWSSTRTSIHLRSMHDPVYTPFSHTTSSTFAISLKVRDRNQWCVSAYERTIAPSRWRMSHAPFTFPYAIYWVADRLHRISKATTPQYIISHQTIYATWLVKTN